MMKMCTLKTFWSYYRLWGQFQLLADACSCDYVSISLYHFITHKVSLCKLLSGWKPSTFGSWITLSGNYKSIHFTERINSVWTERIWFNKYEIICFLYNFTWYVTVKYEDWFFYEYLKLKTLITAICKENGFEMCICTSIIIPAIKKI